MNYNEVFINENIDLEMLKGLNDAEFNDMFKELGISTWGHRHQLKKAVQCFIADASNETNEVEKDINVNHGEDETNKNETSYEKMTQISNVKKSLWRYVKNVGRNLKINLI